MLVEALARYSAAGYDVSGLGDVRIQVINLPGSTLGMAAGRTVFLDADAAARGWFIDPTPSDDSEFTTAGDQGEQGRIDLLTVVMHEIGHLLGPGHEADGLMDDTLAAGTRLNPQDGLARHSVIDGYFTDLSGRDFRETGRR